MMSKLVHEFRVKKIIFILFTNALVYSEVRKIIQFFEELMFNLC
jgi:hypothetical protein